MTTLTLGEFLNINGDPDMPLLILLNDGAGNYENPCNDENYGVWTNAEFAKKPYAEEWCAAHIDNAVDMTVNGVGGYILWVSYRD